MTTYRCKACNWEGMWPAHFNTEKRENGILVLSTIYMCPDCGNKVKPIKN